MFFQQWKTHMARPRNYHIQHITTTVPLEAKVCSDSQEKSSPFILAGREGSLMCSQQLATRRYSTQGESGQND